MGRRSAAQETDMRDDTDSFHDWVADLASEPAPAAAKKSAPQQKWTCNACHGTGKYRGARIHQPKAHCFQCGGRGYFKTSPEKRRKARQSAADRKRAAVEAERARLDSEHSGVLTWLVARAEKSDFARSLVERVDSGKTLSDKQIAAAQSMRAKWEQAAEKRRAEAAASTTEVDLAPIREMFETAMANGYKRPTYRAEGLVINRAPDTGNNPGALYVKNDDKVYGGKVVGTEFKPTRDGRDPRFARGEVERAAADALAVIATDPLAAALRYGQRTGVCACCGRKLTNAVSIEAGIGPVCREKWGL